MEKARKLYFASETEYIYRRYNGLSTIGMDYYNSHHTYLNATDLYEVVNFLYEQVIPSLKNQANLNLIETLGGWEYLKVEISNGASYKQRFGILNAENNAEETFQYIYIAESLKEIIEQSLSTGVPYEIHYNE